MDEVAENGATPLHFATSFAPDTVSSASRLIVLNLLLDFGHDPNRFNNHMYTPLRLAAHNGYLQCAARLLEAGADPNVADDGMDPRLTLIGHPATPLIAAIAHGHLEIVQLLCSYGARRDGSETNRALLERHSLGHDGIANWLAATASFTTRLHYLVDLECSPDRTRAALRSGADVHAARSYVCDGVASPTMYRTASPHSIARELAAGGKAPPGSTAQLVCRAAEVLRRHGGDKTVLTGPWSATNHFLYPQAARARAVELLWVGRWVVGERSLPVHIWIDCVLPFAVPSHQSEESARCRWLEHRRAVRLRSHVPWAMAELADHVRGA